MIALSPRRNFGEEQAIANRRLWRMAPVSPRGSEFRDRGHQDRALRSKPIREGGSPASDLVIVPFDLKIQHVFRLACHVLGYELLFMR